MLWLSLLIIQLASGSDCGLEFEESGECTHKTFLPVLNTELLGYLLIFLAAIVANATGIGGGGIHMPLLILVFQFLPKQAVPLSQCLVLGGAIVATLLNLRKKSTETGEPLIDLNIIAILQPGMLLGTLFGVMLHKVLPETVVVCALCVLLAFITYRSTRRSIKLYRIESLSIRSGEPSQETENSNEKEGVLEEKSLIHSVTPRSPLVILLITVNYLVLVLYTLLKKGKTTLHLIDIRTCSTLDFGLLAAFFVYSSLSETLAYKLTSTELNWGKKRTALYSVVGICSGIASGVLGIGGGLIIAPLLLEIGIEPQTTAATSSFLVLLVASSLILQFILEGMRSLSYVPFLFVWSMFAALIGVTLMRKLIQKYERPSLVGIGLAVCIGTAAVLLPTFQILQIEEVNFEFHSFCN